MKLSQIPAYWNKTARTYHGIALLPGDRPAVYIRDTRQRDGRIRVFHSSGIFLGSCSRVKDLLSTVLPAAQACYNGAPPYIIPAPAPRPC